MKIGQTNENEEKSLRKKKPFGYQVSLFCTKDEKKILRNMQNCKIFDKKNVLYLKKKIKKKK